MLERAELARSEGGAPPRREFAAPRGVTEKATHTVPEPTIRTFRYPNGRYWTVNELQADSTGAERRRPLLRFTSGSRALDTADWPSGWVDMSEQDLTELLYRSFPRDGSATNSTEFRRRRGDIA